jgi:surfactin synthase thioesterase subunit
MSDGINDDQYDMPQETKRGPGRPPRGFENLHTQVPPETKIKIEQLAALFGCSYGDVIAQAVKALLASFKVHVGENK